ncbi:MULTISPECIES: YciI family protein [Aquimarina]|uniref:YciI family protein n=1 Tax=Aquimarina TaxID=290174 RepID=UPI000CDEC3B9|nr:MULTISPECIES: YciI family protein [Aquimarina]
MYIINITYKVPLTKIDSYLNDHIIFLKEQYHLGHFLASGRKEPRNGGIILSTVDKKEALLDILEKDPFKIHDLADYELIEFIPAMTSKEMEFLL